MSQARRKVEWCLRKAEEELEGTGVHRGLVKEEPDQERAEKHVKKAEHNLKAARYFDDGGFSDWSASAFFYCIYHCFLAVLRRHGYHSRNQECTVAAIELLREEDVISIDERFVNALKAVDDDAHQENVIGLRERFQYGVFLEFAERDRFTEFETMCREAIEAAKQVVYRDG